MSEETYRLGRVAVMAAMRECSHGVRYAVEQLYAERERLRRRCGDLEEVVEYLLAGGDPSQVQTWEDTDELG